MGNLRRECPHCKALDTLVTNYSKGEVACSSCCLVVEMGLAEDPRTAFDEENNSAPVSTGVRNVTVSAATAESKKRKGAAGGAPSGSLQADNDRAFRILSAIQQRCGVPGLVADVAQGYVEGFLKHVAATHSDKLPVPLLACAAYALAGALRRYPVQPGELAQQPGVSGVTPSKIDAAMQRLTVVLGLAAERTAAHGTLFQDLVSLYSTRLPVKLTPAQRDVASAIADSYSEAVRSGRSAALVAQIAIYEALYDARRTAALIDVRREQQQQPVPSHEAKEEEDGGDSTLAPPPAGKAPRREAPVALASAMVMATAVTASGGPEPVTDEDRANVVAAAARDGPELLRAALRAMTAGEADALCRAAGAKLGLLS